MLTILENNQLKLNWLKSTVYFVLSLCLLFELAVCRVVFIVSQINSRIALVLPLFLVLVVTLFGCWVLVLDLYCLIVVCYLVKLPSILFPV